MKIGIVTQPLRFNYGGILQNYALQTVLKRMGHEVVTLDGDVKSKKTIRNFLIRQASRIIRLVSNRNNKVFGVWEYRSEVDILSENLKGFINKHILVKKLRRLHESDYDALIVGSDQVWRPEYSNLNEAYLSFAKNWKNIKRISYAASFGTDDWEYTKEEEAYCKELIKKFDSVSVREESGIKLCHDHFGITATHVLDPTLLLTKEDYEHLIIDNESTTNYNQLFYYFLDGNDYKSNILKYLADRLCKTPYTVNSKVENKYMPIKDRVQPPIELWLQAFRDCSFVVTDSFHGCVFSMIFNKPFLVVINENRGKARFDILKLLHQDHRMLFEDQDIKNYDIDLLSPNVNFDNLRKQSLNFLRRNL